MKTNAVRVPFLLMAAVLFLVAALSSSPLMPSVRDAVWDLWRVSVDHSVGGQEFHLLESNSPIGAVFGAGAQRFELFDAGTIAAIHATLSPRVPYHAAIARIAEKHGLDSRLLASVVEAESNFDPSVVSPRGAVGLAQVLPETGDPSQTADLHDPETNLEAGARYLSQLMARYDGDVELALAAYNAGPGRVDRFGGIPPYSETRSYVRRVMSIYEQHCGGDWRN